MKEGGVIAGFARPAELAAAAGGAAAAGFPHWETFTPYAVPEMTGMRSPPDGRSPVARVMAAAGFAGAAGAFFLQEYAARDYPLNVGGRPLNSWPAFVPIAFELGVLSAALGGVLTVFFLAGLPRLDHPVFAAAEFERATQDRFFLLLYADNPGFDPAAARKYLERCRPATVEEVEG